MPLTREDILRAFEGVRRAQNDGRYAPHKPLLLLLALARIQRGEPRLTSLLRIEQKLKSLLDEFGPTGAANRRHLPFWHLQSDRGGALWEVTRSAALVGHSTGSTPTLGALRQLGVEAGFSEEVQQALAADPALIRQAAKRVLDAFFPATLHEDIAAEAGIELTPAITESTGVPAPLRRRDPAFRERMLRAYEYRCCVCGFDLRVRHVPAGLEAAHIHWHTAGGPDVEPNGLSLCALHHKLFDLGAFTIEPAEHRVLFSQHAISGERGLTGVLAHHGKPLLLPTEKQHRPGPEFLTWNRQNVFKRPERSV
ncbi:phosphorothioated DNA-binding restriction endonuclease [Ramlibacter sp.]|uniref:phosphorothioated DNA-binding restriction endonuclease n=1 Tax=Ramlibacter sp. TaxID=1917967 RepID=UPI003D09A45B